MLSKKEIKKRYLNATMDLSYCMIALMNDYGMSRGEVFKYLGM